MSKKKTQDKKILPESEKRPQKISPEPGRRLRALRKKIKLTRVEFQEETGISAATLAHLESGTSELRPEKARTLSLIYMKVYKLRKSEASEEFILYGTNTRKKSSRTSSGTS